MADSEESRLLARLNDPATRAAVLKHIDSLESGTGEPELRRVSSDPRPGVRFAQEEPTLGELLSVRDRELREELADVVSPAVELPPYPDDDDDDDVQDRIELYMNLQRQRAAIRIQDSWRMKALGFDSARIIMALRLDEGAASTPSLDTAREVAREMRPKRESDGEDYSMGREGLASFDAFGCEVACYMRFVTFTGRCMWVALLLNLSNIIRNLEEGSVDNLLGKHSLNNADCLGTSHGAIEALTSLLLVGFCFWLRAEVLSRSAKIASDTDRNKHLTAANFSAQLQGLEHQSPAASARSPSARVPAAAAGDHHKLSAGAQRAAGDGAAARAAFTALRRGGARRRGPRQPRADHAGTHVEARTHD